MAKKRKRQRQKAQRRPPPRARRSYAASLADRLTADFRGEFNSPNEVLRHSLPRMRARSRQLAMDNDYAKEFLRIVQRNVIGPRGIRLQSRTVQRNGQPDTLDNAAIESAWQRWGRRGTCTVDGRSSWLDVQRQVLRTLATDGEVLVRLYRGWPNDFGFAIQVLEADWLDLELNRRERGEREIVLGIEVDALSRPLAYHLLREHPGRILQRRAGLGHEVVPADDILHIYVEDRPGQFRGAPWLHSSIRRLNHLGAYEEGEVVASRAASNKMGTIETPTGTEFVGDGGEAADGSQLDYLEAGTMKQVPAGWKVNLLDPTHPTTAFPATVKQLLRGASAGLGVSYNTLAHDLEGVSFSSIRQGVLDDRDEWQALQAFTGERLNDPVFDAFLPLALLTEQIRGPTNVPLPASAIERFRPHEWQPRGWHWVDPAKDQEVNERSVAAGWKTATMVAAEQGRDLEDIYRKLGEERRLRERYGVQDATPAPLGAPTQEAAA